MLPPPVALRRESSRTGHLLAVLGVVASGSLLATPARGSPNPKWPPDDGVAVDALAAPEYWPADTAYGYAPLSATDDRNSAGQWWLYSFVPERATSAVVLRQPNLPSGLSVDAAWRYTQGDPSVLLGFLDDGLDVTAPDLVEGVYLNPGEFKNVSLQHGDGTPCAALDPSNVDSPKIDCAEPYGVLTISDFCETLGWNEEVGPLDPNGNDRCDPQDLLQLGCTHRLCVTDGLDNDGNGLIDDIAGWDFVDFDNNPFPEYGSGATESALDAIARANNGIDRAGVCPNCRAVAIRTGHQRGSSSQATALGLLYASTLGATAALIGHLPQGKSALLDAAVKVAAQRNLMTFLVRDGEQQTSFSPSFDSDSLRVVGTLTQLNGSTTTTGSFIASDPCQTLEPVTTLFAAAPACSRRGPAIALGLAGLAASAARIEPHGYRPTALELAQLLANSADPLAVDSSGGTTSASLGRASVLRLNANTAVTQVSQAVIPPEIELERPLPLETIVLDNLSLPLSVVGRLSAARASSYDLYVELASGRSPTDSDYEVISKQLATSSNVVRGPGSVLAEVDLRTWFDSHSPGLERTETTGLIATLRVRAIAHRASSTTDTSGDATTEVLRQLVLVTDRALRPGFPQVLGAMPTAPRIADLRGDGAASIVVGTLDGSLLALAARDGRIQDSFEQPVRTNQLPAFRRLVNAARAQKSEAVPPMFAGTPPISAELGREPIAGPVAIADLTRDGRPEVVFTTAPGRLYAVRNDGRNVDGFPRCLTSSMVLDCSTAGADNLAQASAPVIADVDGDNQLEVVVLGRNGKVYAFESDATLVQGWPIQLETPEGSAALLLDAPPAVADMNGDQIGDVIVGVGEPRSAHEPYTTWYVTVLGAKPPSAPMVAAAWPVATLSYDFLVDRTNRASPPPSIDLSEREPRALLYGNATVPFFLPLHPGGISQAGTLPKRATPSQGFALVGSGADSEVKDAPLVAPLYARPVLGDLDRDGEVDLVLPATTAATLDSLRSAATPREHRSLLAFWNGATGAMLPASPIELKDLVGSQAPIIADITNDGYPEMITFDGEGSLVAYDACGRSPQGWPKVIGGTLSQSPAIGDLDNDGRLEVVAVTDDGRVFAWNTEARATSFVPWGTALHDNLNQSAHHPPLRTEPAAPGPLPLSPSGGCLLPQSSPDVQPAPQLSARGGCGCRTVGHSYSGGLLSVQTAALLALLRRAGRRWRARRP